LARRAADTRIGTVSTSFTHLLPPRTADPMQEYQLQSRLQYVGDTRIRLSDLLFEVNPAAERRKPSVRQIQFNCIVRRLELIFDSIRRFSF
jgi:hypothetical protein